MTIRAASEADLGAITALEECFPATQRWSQTLWRDEVAADDHLVLVAADQATTVAAASFARAGDVVDLNRVVVAASHRRRGLAKQLLAHGFAWARSGGAERVMLEVRHDNQAALALYRHLGFQQLAQRRDYYGRGIDAVVLASEIGDANPGDEGSDDD